MVDNSPYPSHMAIALDHIETDEANIVINLAECHLQPYGIVYAGVVATGIDTATFWSAFLRLPKEAGFVNVGLKLNYRQSVVNARLIAKGTCMRPGRTISYAEASVFDENKT